MEPVFAGIPPAEIDKIMRRTLVASGIVAAFALAAAFEFGHPLIGAGVLIGLGLGLANSRAFQVSAARLITPAGTLARRPFAASVLGRLALVTLVAFGLLVLERQLGWGAIIGLSLFQLLMVTYAARAMLRYARAGLDSRDA